LYPATLSLRAVPGNKN